MSVPRFYLFHKPLLEAIADERPNQNKDIKEIMSSAMNLRSDDLKAMLPSGKQTVFDNRYAWARIYLKRAGLLENLSRSVIVITQEGKKVLQENPDIIDAKYLSRYESFRVFTNQNMEEDTPEIINEEADDTPQENLERAFSKINNRLADEILSEITKQTPEFFEHLVVDLLKKMGYGGSLADAGTVTGRTGDEGIDGVMREDKLGFNLIYIQAKRWDINQTVGRPEIMKFVGALAGQDATKGLFITTARFSKEARAYAEKQHTTKVVLVDGDHMCKLMIEHNLP
jgi:restriction system protein